MVKKKKNQTNRKQGENKWKLENKEKTSGNKETKWKT